MFLKEKRNSQFFASLSEDVFLCISSVFLIPAFFFLILTTRKKNEPPLTSKKVAEFYLNLNLSLISLNSLHFLQFYFIKKGERQHHPWEVEEGSTTKKEGRESGITQEGTTAPHQSSTAHKRRGGRNATPKREGRPPLYPP